jgi:hypothetical protein
MTLKDALGDIIPAMGADGRIVDSDTVTWEDDLIAAQRRVRELRLS